MVSLLTFLAMSTFAHAGAAGTPPTLEGSWVTDCLGDKTISGIAKITFKDGRYTAKQALFIGPPMCGSETRVDYRATGTYTITERKDFPEYADGHVAIDYSVEKVLNAVSGYKGLELANSQKICGLTGWKDYEFKDVTQTECGDDFWMTQSPFSILQIKDGKLSIGKSEGANSGKKAESRHIVLETKFTFGQEK